MAFMNLRLYSFALILVGLANDQGVDAWTSCPTMRTALGSSTQLYKYKRDYPYKNEVLRRRREQRGLQEEYGEYDRNEPYYDYNDDYNDGYRGDTYDHNNQGYNNQGYNNQDYGYNNVQYSGTAAPPARASQRWNDNSYDNRNNNQGYNNQDYGYNNVQYSGTAAPLARSSQTWNDYSYDNKNYYNGLAYNEPYMRPMNPGAPMSRLVKNYVSSAVAFSDGVDSAIERMMTPLIKKSSRGLSGTLRKGMNDKMMRLAPEDADVEGILDQCLEILRYDAYVVQDLLQAQRRIELAPHGKSIFCQYSNVSSEIINNRQETFVSTKLGCHLNYPSWKMYVESSNGILERLILVHDIEKFEYDVLQNYNRNTVMNTQLGGYIDI